MCYVFHKCVLHTFSLKPSHNTVNSSFLLLTCSKRGPDCSFSFTLNARVISSSFCRTFSSQSYNNSYWHYHKYVISLTFSQSHWTCTASRVSPTGDCWSNWLANGCSHDISSVRLARSCTMWCNRLYCTLNTNSISLIEIFSLSQPHYDGRAQFFTLCTNTMGRISHKWLPRITA